MRMSAFDAIGQIPDDLGAVFAAAPELINSRANHLSQSARREAMRTSKIIHVVTCHAEGEVGDVIVGGVAPRRAKPCGSSRASSPRTALAQFRPQRAARRRLPARQSARASQGPESADGLHHHGAGGYAAHVGFELDLRRDCAARRRHSADAGAETHLTLEAPGGLITVTAECRNGKAERISIENVPSFADRLDAPLEVKGLGSLKVDIAYGGDSFVIVDAAALGFAIAPDEARDLAETGRPHHRRRQRAARLLPSRG